MVFDKNWFIKYQKALLVFANTRFGRFVLRIHGNRSDIGKNKILGILPNAIFWTENGETIKAEFRTHDKFAKRIYYQFKYLWWMFHWWDMLFANNWKPEWNLGFDSTGNLFPAAGANSPVDGRTQRSSVNETFATICAGAGTTASASDITLNLTISSSSTTNQFSTLARGVVCFNTSGIGSATIDSATLSLYPISKTNPLGSSDINLTPVTLASTAAVASGDYSNFGSTVLGSISYASVSAFSYNNMTLNSDGRDNINKVGVSQFGIRHNWDVASSFGGAWVSSVSNTFSISMADQSGTSQDPKLVVNYTPLAKPGFLGFMGFQ